MKSRWVEKEAGKQTDAFNRCLYGARLLGADKDILLSGGGNASIKDESADTLHIKASGQDMAGLTAKSMPAVSLSKAQSLKELQSLSDADMIATLRTFMENPDGPSPSVETLMHAFLPHAVVYHTHPVAILCLTNEINGERKCEAVFGDGSILVPYAPSGFLLAKAVIKSYERKPSAPFLILEKHGLVSFGKTAKEAYEASIAAISCAENYIKRKERDRGEIFFEKKGIHAAPLIRELEEALGASVSFRNSDVLLAYLDLPNLEELSQRGVATPGDVLRTKPWPMIWWNNGSLEKALGQFRKRYHEYIIRNGGNVEGINDDPVVILMPGVGLFAIGKGKKEAEKTADVGEFTAKVILGAEAIGTYTPISEAEMFHVEFMSLEGGRAQTLKI